jgi:hypothetical protein
MATLAGQKIKDKYGNLLHVEGGVNTTIKDVEDGGGTVTALSVSTDKVQVDALKFSTAPASGSSSTALALDSNNDVVLVSIGSGGGATSLGNLTDVSLLNVGGGDLLSFNGSNWVNSNPGDLGLISGIVDADNNLSFIGANASGNVLFDAGSGMNISYNNATSTVTFESTSSGFEETFIGAVSTDIALATNAATDIMRFTPANNTTDSTSFHFKVGTAKLQLDTVNGEYIENVSSAAVPVHIDITAFTETTQNSKDIIFTLEKFNGAAWNDIKSVARSKSESGSHADSFWSIFMLGVNERFRISLSTTTGGITLEQESRVSFTVKEVGN